MYRSSIEHLLVSEDKNYIRIWCLLQQIPSTFNCILSYYIAMVHLDNNKYTHIYVCFMNIL